MEHNKHALEGLEKATHPTWTRVVKKDVPTLNFNLYTAGRKVKDRQFGITLVGMAMFS